MSVHPCLPDDDPGRRALAFELADMGYGRLRSGPEPSERHDGTVTTLADVARLIRVPTDEERAATIEGIIHAPGATLENVLTAQDRVIVDADANTRHSDRRG